MVIGIGGFLGAVLRYWVSGLMHLWYRGDFPLGTFVVNVVGSFFLGVVIGITEHYIIHPQLRLFLTIGFFGAFTTFSTFSYETVMLVQVGDFFKAFLNIFLSIGVGFVAAFLGLVIGRMI